MLHAYAWMVCMNERREGFDHDKVAIQAKWREQVGLRKRAHTPRSSCIELKGPIEVFVRQRSDLDLGGLMDDGDERERDVTWIC